MHDDMKDEVTMKLEVKMTDLFANIDPQKHESTSPWKMGRRYYMLD